MSKDPRKRKMNGREWIFLLVSAILILSVPLTLWYIIRGETPSSNILLSGEDWDTEADVDGAWFVDQGSTPEDTLEVDGVVYITWPGDSSVTYGSWKFTNYTAADFVADEIQSVNVSLYMGGSAWNATDIHEAWIGGGALNQKDVFLTDISDDGAGTVYISEELTIVDRLSLTTGYISIGFQLDPVKADLGDTDVWESSYNFTGPAEDTVWTPTNRVTKAWFSFGFVGVFMSMLMTRGVDIKDIRKALTGGWQT